jgi:adenosylhomocysteine nucleosidase
MEEELTMLRSRIEDGEILRSGNGGFEFFSGNLEGKAVVLLRCGIGKVNAAVGCALLLDRFKPSLVINTGSAGGTNPALKIGDAVISTGLIQHDVDLISFGYEPGQLPGLPAILPVEDQYIERAEKAVEALKKEGALPADFSHVRGHLGSGDTFMSDPDRIAGVLRVFPSISAMEMEGAAIVQTCRLFSVPALVIRAISDVAGLESPLTFDQFLPMAAKHSAAIVERIIKDGAE